MVLEKWISEQADCSNQRYDISYDSLETIVFFTPLIHNLAQSVVQQLRQPKNTVKFSPLRFKLKTTNYPIHAIDVLRGKRGDIFRLEPCLQPLFILP